MREGCEIQTGDLRDHAVAREAIDGCSHVIHLAAIVGGIANFHKLPHTLTEVNNALSASVVSAALAHGYRALRLRVVVDGVRARHRVPDDRGGHPRRARHRGRRTASRSSSGEVYARAAHDQHGLRYTICRPFNAYGPGELPDPDEPGIAHAVPDLITKALTGRRPLQIFGDGTQTRTLTHVDDIADGIVTAMASPAGENEDFNISASEELTRRRDRPPDLERLRERSRCVRARAPAELRGRRPAPLALGGEGQEPTRLGGPDRPARRHRADRGVAARAQPGIRPAITSTNGGTA